MTEQHEYASATLALIASNSSFSPPGRRSSSGGRVAAAVAVALALALAAAVAVEVVVVVAVFTVATAAAAAAAVLALVLAQSFSKEESNMPSKKHS